MSRVERGHGTLGEALLKVVGILVACAQGGSSGGSLCTIWHSWDEGAPADAWARMVNGLARADEWGPHGSGTGRGHVPRCCGELGRGVGPRRERAGAAVAGGGC